MADGNPRDDGTHRIERIIAAALDDLWALTESKAYAMRELLILRASGQRLDRAEIRAAMGAAMGARPVRGAARGVALVPARGVLAARMNMILEASGGSSTEQLAADVRSAVADDGVSSVLIWFDSPGGSCAGLTEAAAALLACRGVKPIWGIASHEAASAACVLLATCDRVIASPSAMVGALGVLSLHQDVSGAEAKAGITTSIISTPRYKGEGNPFRPLDDAARSAIQRRVDATYAQLVADVAAGRGVSAQVVREHFGEGRILNARDALACGLIDDIASLDDTLAELASGHPNGRRNLQSARAIWQEPRALAHQELAQDDWQRRVALDLRLLDL